MLNHKWFMYEKRRHIRFHPLLNDAISSLFYLHTFYSVSVNRCTTVFTCLLLGEGRPLVYVCIFACVCMQERESGSTPRKFESAIVENYSVLKMFIFIQFCSRGGKDWKAERKKGNRIAHCTLRTQKVVDFKVENPVESISVNLRLKVQVVSWKKVHKFNQTLHSCAVKIFREKDFYKWTHTNTQTVPFRMNQ